MATSPTAPVTDYTNSVRRVLAMNTDGTPVSSTNPSTVQVAGTITAKTSASFTRPANTTAYAVNDVLGTSVAGSPVLTFTNVSRVTGRGAYIQRARLVKNGTTVTSATFRLYLYASSPSGLSSLVDNDPWPMLWANRAIRIGFIDFPTMITGGTGSDSSAAQIYPVNLPVLPEGSTSIFGVLVTQAAYTPASAEQFHVELMVDQY